MCSTITNMASIESLTPASGPALTEAARDLFRAYAAFLREIQACHAFNFTRFEDEIRTLPDPYTSAAGELLLALNSPETPVGCLAYRAAPEPQTCELKRLFVLPSHRGQRLAEQLIDTALAHARARGFRFAVLDTEPSTMQAAEHIYRKLGFIPYQPATALNPIDVLYLRRPLDAPDLQV